MPQGSTRFRTITTLLERALSNVVICALPLLVAMTLIAVVTDGSLLAIAGVSPAHLAGGAAAAFGLAISMALVCSIPLALLLGVCLKVARARSWLRHGWVAVVFLVVLVLSWRILDPSVRVETGAYRLCAVLAAVATTTALWSTTAKRAVVRWLVCTPLAVGASVLDLRLVSSWYPEFHTLFHMFQVVGLLSLCAPIIRRLSQFSTYRLAAVTSACFAASLLILYSVDTLAPGWRWTSELHSRHASSLAKGLRAIVDFDGDGYSPVAWGVDCDDWNSERNPRAIDEPGGGDANCNGTDPSEPPSDSDRGLTPAFGDPVLPTDAIDIVVLVTVECFRSDVFKPELMPNLWAFSQSGIRFERAYSGNSQTQGSLKVLFNSTSRGQVPLIEGLREAGVHTTAIVANNPLAADYGDLFDEEIRSEHAPFTTESVLKTVAARPGRQFIWAHYYDSHAPFVGHPEFQLPGDLTGFPKQPEYLSELAFVDDALGTLLTNLPRERSLIIVTGDHGEAFGEHGVMRHGQGGFEEIVHVAAVAGFPGATPHVHGSVVSHRDIPPTVLGGFGLSERVGAAETFGRSWLRLRGAPAKALHEFVVVRTYQSASGSRGDSPLGVLIDNRYKLIGRYEDHLFALYDLLEGDETADLAGSEVTLAAKLWRALALYSDLDQYP